ncbi:hypothetical protein LINPERPRIM_LOCUS32812 [Linum perenne]
MRGRRGTWS